MVFSVSLKRNETAILSARSVSAEMVYLSNQIFIRHSLQQLLGGAFPHLLAHDVGRVVEGLFALNQNPEAVRMHLRDFLIQV